MSFCVLDGSLTDPLQTVVVDVGGNGAVSADHNANGAGFVQDLEDVSLDLFTGAGVDVGSLLEAAADGLAAEQLLALCQANAFSMDESCFL